MNAPIASMSTIVCRPAQLSDVPALARIRAQDWGDEEYWLRRVTAYMQGESHPQQSLPERVVFVAECEERVVGLVAGHLTRRYKCDGELEWINVLSEYQRRGVASVLLRGLAEWFKERNALRICVDVQPKNTVARSFYRQHGAEDLNLHWLVWPDIRRALEVQR